MLKRHIFRLWFHATTLQILSMMNTAISKGQRHNTHFFSFVWLKHLLSTVKGYGPESNSVQKCECPHLELHVSYNRLPDAAGPIAISMHEQARDFPDCISSDNPFTPGFHFITAGLEWKFLHVNQCPLNVETKIEHGVSNSQHCIL